MKQLVVERNNPVPVIWETPIPQPGPNEVLIRNHYSVVSSGTELASIESANKSVTDKLQDSSNISKGLDLLKKEGLGAVIDAVFPKNVLPLQLGYSSCGEVLSGVFPMMCNPISKRKDRIAQRVFQGSIFLKKIRILR